MIIYTPEELHDPYSAVLSTIQTALDVADSYSLAMSTPELGLFNQIRLLIEQTDPAAVSILRKEVRNDIPHT